MKRSVSVLEDLLFLVTISNKKLDANRTITAIGSRLNNKSFKIISATHRPNLKAQILASE